MRPTGRDQKGFSMLEIIVAAGIGTIVMLGMTSYITQSFKQMSQLEAKMETVDISTSITNAFALANTCSQAFSNQRINLTNIPQNGHTFDLSLPGYSSPLTEGGTVGKLYVDKLRITSATNSGANPNGGTDHLVNFDLGFKNKGANGFPFKTLQKSVILTVDASNQITGCIAAGGNNNGPSPSNGGNGPFTPDDANQMYAGLQAQFHYGGGFYYTKIKFDSNGQFFFKGTHQQVFLPTSPTIFAKDFFIKGRGGELQFCLLLTNSFYLLKGLGHANPCPSFSPGVRGYTISFSNAVEHSTNATSSIETKYSPWSR